MPAARNDVFGRFDAKMNNNMPPEAGASKGKGPNPENWGNVRLNGRQCPHYGDSGQRTAGSTQMTMKS